MNQITIGKFIAERRKERGFLQKDIAIRLGISEKTVSKWECGNGLPEVIYMEPLCQILGITVNELLAGKTIPILELSANGAGGFRWSWGRCFPAFLLSPVVLFMSVS